MSCAPKFSYFFTSILKFSYGFINQNSKIGAPNNENFVPVNFKFSLLVR